MDRDQREVQGFIRRTQKRFNRDHHEVAEYGECDNLVLSDEYTKEEAGAKFLEYMTLNGMNPSDYSTTKEDIYTASFGVGEWEGELSYMLGDGDYASDCWQGWVFNIG